MKPGNPPRIIFITGTDTGAGKTLLTGLLLAHLRRTGTRAWALKPFCSGGRGDARLLSTLQDHELPLDEVNPYFFSEPVAPLVGLRNAKNDIPLKAVVQHVRSVATRLAAAPPQSKFENQKSKILLVEGSGGLFVPLGEGYSVLDLIAALGSEVLVAGWNRLGTMNHCLLTVRALQQAGLRKIRLVLMESGKPDTSARTNLPLLTEFLAPLPVVSLPFLTAPQRRAQGLKTTAARLQRVLSHLI